jgi:hypothetical protein
MFKLSVDEITEYCTDKLEKEQHRLIPDICSLGTRIPDFSYDILRSIVFELNTGKCGLAETGRVLNIASKARSPFNFTIYFKLGKTETGFEYIDTAQSRYHIDWYVRTDGIRDTAAVNMLEAQWTGGADGSLILDGKHVCWMQREKKSDDRVEKIVFVPAKEGYLSEDNYRG